MVIADTSFIVAVAIQTDKRHRDCVAVFKQQPRIFLPQSTFAEIAFMLTRAGGIRATIHFFRGLPKSKYSSISLENEDLERAADILEKYADTRVDFVDATIAAIAERLNVARILTLDQRDFQILRPSHIERFEILPGG